MFLKRYPSVVFLTVKTDLDEQIENRMFLLSATVNQKKLMDSLDLQSEKAISPDGFMSDVQNNVKRRNLMARIRMPKTKEIQFVKFRREDVVKITKRFREEHPRLKPRSQRDYPRCLALIQAHALLNYDNRTLRNQSIYVNDTDIEASLELYKEIAKPNEVGIEPGLYGLATEVLKPVLEGAGDEGIALMRFRALWSEYSGGHLSDRTLARKFEQLELTELIERGKDAQDKRSTKIYASASRC